MITRSMLQAVSRKNAAGDIGVLISETIFSGGLGDWLGSSDGTSSVGIVGQELRMYMDAINSFCRVELLTPTIGPGVTYRLVYKARSPDLAAIRFSDNGGGGFSLVAGSSNQALTTTATEYFLDFTESISGKRIRPFLLNQSNKEVFIEYFRLYELP